MTPARPAASKPAAAPTAADPAPARLPLWIDVRAVPVNKRLGLLRAAADAKAQAILVDKGDPHIHRAGLTAVVVGADGQLRKAGQRIGRLLDVADAAGQDKAATAKGLVVVHAKTWRVIPLENLVAARRDRPGTLYAVANDAAEARLFAGTLDTGVHGIVLAARSPREVAETDAALRSMPSARPPARPAAAPALASKSRPSRASDAANGRLALRAAKLTAVRDAGMGDRVCVDTTSHLRAGEGLLVGSTARGFVLVHAETVESEFVRARPFRVNAGALHMYVLSPDGKTRYLSELGAGDPVLVVGRDGTQRTVTLGRVKLEHRPHTLLEWRAQDGKGMAVVQTAETIRLCRPDGALVAVTDLKVGDEVLVHDEDAARHFGMPTDARLEER